MGHRQSKARNTTAPATGQSAQQRLYPNLASEFPTYARPTTVDFRCPPTNPYEACFGNPIPNFVPEVRPSYCYNPAPSAPPATLTELPAPGHSGAKQEDWLQTRQAESSQKQNRGKNDDEEDKRNNDRPQSNKACPNAAIGCILHFDAEQMKEHLKECLFRDFSCPLNGVLGKCSWQDKLKNMTTHFEDNHPNSIGQVNHEYTLTGLRTVHLVELKPYKFLVHIKVDEDKKEILVTVQACNTQFLASKWVYEFHFTGPHLEKTLDGTCYGSGVSIAQKFKKMQCRVLPMSICFMDGFKRGGVKYKFRIMKKDGVTKTLEANRNPSKDGISRNTAKEGTSRNTSKHFKNTNRNKRVAAT